MFEIAMFAVVPLLGMALALILSRRPALSGRAALALAVVPYVGAVLTVVWC